MTTSELQAACAARGIRAVATSADRLRDELAQWLDMHVNHQVPSTLLILSRAFTYTDQSVSTEEALQATFNSLPDNLVNEAELQVLELVGATTYKQKLDVLEQQQELIEDESEQEQKEAEARREATASIEAAPSQLANDAQAVPQNPVTPPEEPVAAPESVPTLDDALSEEQQEELREALALLRTKIGVLEERAQLNEIKIQHEDYKEVCSRFSFRVTNGCVSLACGGSRGGYAPEIGQNYAAAWEASGKDVGQDRQGVGWHREINTGIRHLTRISF